MFVLVACPENALLDSRDFYKPVVTPLELEIALGTDGRSWTGDYSTDFALLLLHADDVNDVVADAVDATDGAPGSNLQRRGLGLCVLPSNEASGGEAEGQEAQDGNSQSDDEDAPQFSLVTGGLMSMPRRSR